MAALFTTGHIQPMRVLCEAVVAKLYGLVADGNIYWDYSISMAISRTFRSSTNLIYIFISKRRKNLGFIIDYMPIIGPVFRDSTTKKTHGKGISGAIGFFQCFVSDSFSQIS